MVLQWTSMGNVIARVARNMGGQLPGQFVADMPEWIDEAMLQLETKWSLIKTSTPARNCPGEIITQQHVAALPCGMSALIAVEDENGRRMRYGTDEIDTTLQTARYYPNSPNGTDTSARSTNFQMDVFQSGGSNPYTTEATDTAIPWDGSDIIPAPYPSRTWYYQIQGNRIQTSEEAMFVRLHYLKVPTDGDGLPMVPDNENYKQALFFYVIKQLVAAGAKHPIWVGPPGYNFCNSEFERFAGRAIAEITYPTVDVMERLRVAWAERIVFPYSKWEDFSIGYEQVQDVQGI